MPWGRIRTDFRFAIAALFAGVTVLVVVPFAIYRFVHGEVIVGLVDLGIVLCIVAAFVHVMRGGDIEHALRVVVASYSIGCVLVANLVGLAGILWMYPLLLANFLLVDRRIALGVSAATIAAMLLNPDVFSNGLQLLMFLATAVVVCLFAFIFAYRTDSQRMQLEALASLDPLTGVQNRRALDRELQIAIEVARRQHTPHGLAVLDLDHFKHINDSHGHEAGDRVLVDFAALVTRGTRKGDRFFRLGGEEFVLLLPGADVAALQGLCEQLRARATAELKCAGDAITVSIGAAALAPGEDAASWQARADAAMYEAKRRGRNQVVVDGGREIPGPQ